MVEEAKSNWSHFSGAIIAGIAGGWFLVFLGKNVPTLFGFEPAFHPGEAFLVLSLLGLTFGFYIGRAMQETYVPFVFISFFLGWVVTSMLLYFPPFFDGIEPTFSIALAVPAVFSLSAYFSIFGRPGRGKQWFEIISGEISWYLLVIHIGYAYQRPFTIQFLSMIAGETFDLGLTLAFFILTALWVAMFRLVYFVARISRT